MTLTETEAPGENPLVGLPDLAALADYDENLRQVAADPPAIEAAMASAQGRLERAETTGDRRAALALLGYLGNGFRILGRHAEAIAHHERAVALASTWGRPKAEAAAMIRLGEAHRNADNLNVAERILRTALDRVRANRVDLGVYEDFALQHLGKCLTDAGRAAEAIPCLEEALAQRRRKDDAELIASTEAALRAARLAADSA